MEEEEDEIAESGAGAKAHALALHPYEGGDDWRGMGDVESKSRDLGSDRGYRVANDSPLPNFMRFVAGFLHSAYLTKYQL
jgi:hypothetical protein